MPIVTVFDPTRYIESLKAMLREHLRDTFPEDSFNFTYDTPSTDSFTKPILWLRCAEGREGRIEHIVKRDGSAGSGITMELTWVATIITNQACGGLTKADTCASMFEDGVINKGKTALGAVDIKKISCGPFVPVPLDSQQPIWVLSAEFTFEILIERR